ncbi:MAG: 5-(carboxyamino)imidazole ribonucleotide synthase [Planctomycetia bacterium]|nr:5-(carboxyamino)imidazole ribonucleotide synthase [Planctomycetia bacterium]
MSGADRGTLSGVHHEILSRAHSGAPNGKQRPRPILPGATIGVLGSGQLGRMFAIAARRMGYRVHTLSPDNDTPTGQVADQEIVAAYDDLDAIRQFARNVAVVTFEFENVPAPTAEAAEQSAPVRPAGRVLHITQHRLREKTFLSEAGFPVTPFAAVRSIPELNAAIDKLGCPAVLKTAGWGYDGKGQFKMTSAGQAEEAWRAVSSHESVLEAFVDFGCEISVVGVRSSDGTTVTYPAIENSHRRHILDLSCCPARIPDQTARRAAEITRNVLHSLDCVGVLCVEFFVTRDGGLVINELAPRPHNSGHLTIDACVTCQFEQQLRAICDLPLGSTELLRPAAAMANLLGDLWGEREPDWEAACALDDVKLHLYGKLQARPGRKMGHLTALAATPDAALARVEQARRALGDGTGV